MRGPAGIGKTTLLEYLLDDVSDLVVARVTGVESEAELAFAALHHLCRRMLDRIDELPPVQADALGGAFGLHERESPDLFLVGLAVLSLFSDVAAERPLLVVVDNAQWLDRASAQVLAFVARRLDTESVGLVFGIREPAETAELAGLADLEVNGLSDVEARELLATAIPGRLDEDVRDQLIVESEGNPLALLELPRGLTPAQLAGGFGLLSPLPLVPRIERSFLRRGAHLPAETQELLLLAAADPVGDPVLLRRAAELLDIGLDAAAPAEAAGLFEVGARVRFHHPLVRSAIYQTATPDECRRVHRALAEATDPSLDPDRRAWHRARAALGPDEDVAVELERSATRARARGGLAAAAAFLGQATALTPASGPRAVRALTAARVSHDAGSPDAALELLTTAERGRLDELQRAQLHLLRAQIAFSLRRGSDAPGLFLEAAKQLEPLDAALAREAYLEAILAAIRAGRLANSRGLIEAAEAARAAPPPPSQPRPVDFLLDGLALRITEGYRAGVAPLTRALTAFCDAADSGDDDFRWLWLAYSAAIELWDEDAWHALTIRQVQRAREVGALTALPPALAYLSGLHVFAGEFANAAALIDEETAISVATGKARSTSALLLAAWVGEPTHASELIDSIVHDATQRGEGRAITLTEYASAVLNNGRGNYPAAFAAARRAKEHDDLGFDYLILPELVEASSRSGDAEFAATALDRLSERTRAIGTESALGIEARSRALLESGEVAESLYREAIDRFERSRIVVHRARARLIYGEWLRRERRQVDAREQLRRAYEMFVAMGAEGFATRTARELAATGERARQRTVDTLGQLTPREMQIARLASQHHSNTEIGAQLFISARTVEYHLHNVFAKLGISSRKQLGRALER